MNNSSVYRDGAHWLTRVASSCCIQKVQSLPRQKVALNVVHGQGRRQASVPHTGHQISTINVNSHVACARPSGRVPPALRRCRVHLLDDSLGACEKMVDPGCKNFSSLYCSCCQHCSVRLSGALIESAFHHSLSPDQFHIPYVCVYEQTCRSY